MLKDDGNHLQQRWVRRGAPPVIAPDARLGVVPAAVGQLADLVTVAPVAALTPSLGTPEPDGLRDDGPVERIQGAVLRSDRHGAILEQTMNRANPLYTFRHDGNCAFHDQRTTKLAIALARTRLGVEISTSEAEGFGGNPADISVVLENLVAREPGLDPDLQAFVVNSSDRGLVEP